MCVMKVPSRSAQTTVRVESTIANVSAGSEAG